MDPISAEPHQPDIARPPYNPNGSRLLQHDFATASGDQTVFPFVRRKRALVLDDIHTRAMHDALSIALRLLRHRDSSWRNRDTPLPHILIDEMLTSDGEVDITETNTVRIRHVHVRTAGYALYMLEAPNADAEARLTYTRHSFLLGLILAATIRKCGHEDDDVARMNGAWQWEYKLFGGWLHGSPAPGSSQFEIKWYGRIASIILRVPFGKKYGACESYTVDDSIITRIVEGKDSWEDDLKLVKSTAARGVAVIAGPIREAGPQLGRRPESSRLVRRQEADGTVLLRRMWDSRLPSSGCGKIALRKGSRSRPAPAPLHLKSHL